MRETSAQKRDKLYEALLAEKARRAAAQHDYDWRNVGGCKLPQGRGEGQCDKHARPEQIAPDWAWRTWLLLAGRGFGKTRCGAEWVREQVKTSKYVNLVGATADDARDIQIEGETGLLQICPKGERPVYLPSKRRLEWPNGAISLIFTADEPERMRGKQHEKLWLDELAAWKYPESYDQAMLGLRLGQRPQVVITTTPKPTRLIKEIKDNPTTHVTRGTTYDNRANLAPEFFADIVKKYEGTRMGRQELNAEILTDNPNALWSRDMIDKGRIQPGACPKLARVVVAIDPAVTSNEDSDLTGIVVVGKFKDECFVLEDCSLSASPDAWAKRAIRAYTQHEADRIVAETNNGGDLVEAVLRTVNRSVPYRKVHASRGKQIRAEPVAALYEQGKVHHVGSLPMLEDEMCDYDPTLAQKSPDRMDALVWAVSELTQGPTRAGHVTELRI